MNSLKQKIAGEITLAKNPGAAIKKWREIFGITQTELADYLKITPSTISDYESNRRKSPGIGVIQRFIEALIEIDTKKGGWVTNVWPVRNDRTSTLLKILKNPCLPRSLLMKSRGKL